MANEQSKRQSERQQDREHASGTQSSAIERGGGERGLATRHYQDPFSIFDSMFERMQRELFGSSLLNALIPARGSETGDARRSARMPRVQMRDTADALEVTAEMPGIDGTNVSVSIDDDVLTISGEQREEQEAEGTRAESYTSFYRQIPLPGDIDTENAKASHRNGLLTVRFPKRTARSTAREIPVSTQPSTGQEPPSKERAA
jgi:HSP20 family protein